MKAFVKYLSDWEHWPFGFFYFPLFFPWIWYCIRSRSLWFFSTSNPTLTFGGFEGESKKEMYRLLPEKSYPESFFINPAISFSEVLRKIKDNNFKFPFIVKPDIGMKGLLFRKIDNEQHLQHYHRHMPAEYIVQKLIEMPIEVSVFYYRFPDEKKGHISAFIQKELLQVKGDGKSTLRELISNHPSADSWLHETAHLQETLFQKIIPEKEIFYGSYIGNRYHGAKFKDLSHLIDDQLTGIFDTISFKSKFCYGRYDIKCYSADDMRKGEFFSIMEFNGAGSIPNHIYTGGFTILQAYKEIIRHWKILYDISACNHQQGLPYWDLLKGWRFLSKAKKHFRVLEKLDKKVP